MFHFGGAVGIYSNLHFRKKVGVMYVSMVFSLLVYRACTSIADVVDRGTGAKRSLFYK